MGAVCHSAQQGRQVRGNGEAGFIRLSIGVAPRLCRIRHPLAAIIRKADSREGPIGSAIIPVRRSILESVCILLCCCRRRCAWK